ncbi:MAG TPA: MBL fold metallo-hydrolase [Candidatus Limnocylindrales bacterium]|nr:MBL fold metallo-hydrolase [Candidatus Limnocylindrales bacterium]
MFRKSKAGEISGFFAIPMEKNGLAVFYLDASGFIIRSLNQTVLIDPAGMLKDDEVNALKAVNLILFTHDHLDHFSTRKTEAIVKATAAPVLAEPKVASKLEGKMPADKLVSAEDGKAYTLGGVTATAIQGIHRGPIILYQIKMDGVSVFHGGDSGYVSLKDYPSQVAIVPVGGMSPTASPENAYKMVADLKPDIAITMHGSDKQKQQFEQKVKQAMPQTTVLLMAPFTLKTFSVPQKP